MYMYILDIAQMDPMKSLNMGLGRKALDSNRRQ